MYNLEYFLFTKNKSTIDTVKTLFEAGIDGLGDENNLSVFLDLS